MVDLLISVCVVLAVENGTADFNSPVIRVRGGLWLGNGRKQPLPVIKRLSCPQGPRREGGTWRMSYLPLETASLDTLPLRFLLDSDRKGLSGAGDRGCSGN